MLDRGNTCSMDLVIELKYERTDLRISRCLGRKYRMKVMTVISFRKEEIGDLTPGSKLVYLLT